MPKLVVVVLCLMVATAAAQPSEPKSPTTALILSTAPIAGGIALLVVANGFGLGGGDSWALGTTNETTPKGWVIIAGVVGTVGGLAIAGAPSFGHVYTRDAWNFGLKLKLVGAGVLAGAVTGFLLMGDVDESEIGTSLVVGGIGALGCAAFGVGWIYELATTHRSARRYNAALTPSTMTLMPTANGLALTGTF